MVNIPWSFLYKYNIARIYMPKHYKKIAIDIEHELYDLTDTERKELMENIKSILEIRGDIKSIKKLERINDKISKYTDVKLP